MRHYDEVMIDREYSFVEKEKIVIRFEGYFFRFETYQAVIDEELFCDYVTWKNNDVDTTFDFTLKHVYDRELVHDSFSLKIGSDKVITIATKTRRGFDYAQKALVEMLVKKEKGILVKYGQISHTPSFEMRGIIEGFYGVPWTWDNRQDCIQLLVENQMNTYMYAPKDDEYQRKLWRELYPENYLNEFKGLLKTAEEKKIDFWYMISPGNDIDYLKLSELEVLFTKLRQMIDLGINHFGLLLDDIDYILKDQAKIKFGTSAKAHAYIVNQVDEFLSGELANYQLVACPTEYDNHYDAEYLEILNNNLKPHIPLFWTGPSTLAAKISHENIQKMAAVYQREIIIWDNVPVNDFEKDYERLFLSPYDNRSKFLAEEKYHVRGIVLNPMAQWEWSKITINHAARYLWQVSSFNQETVWLESLKQSFDEEYLEAVQVFLKHNHNRHTHNVRSFEMEQSLEMKDKNKLSEWLIELNVAIEKLSELENHPMIKEGTPWFERAKLDFELWQAILASDKVKVEELKEVCQKSNYRIGTDLVMGYLG